MLLRCIGFARARGRGSRVGAASPGGEAFNPGCEVGFEGRPQTGHLWSAVPRGVPVDSEQDREVSPRKPEEIGDRPSRFVALDLFQRSPVQILNQHGAPPQRQSVSVSRVSRATSAASAAAITTVMVAAPDMLMSASARAVALTAESIATPR